jgi:hypothetical protein
MGKKRKEKIIKITIKKNKKTILSASMPSQAI